MRTPGTRVAVLVVRLMGFAGEREGNHIVLEGGRNGHGASWYRIG